MALKWKLASAWTSCNEDQAASRGLDVEPVERLLKPLGCAQFLPSAFKVIRQLRLSEKRKSAEFGQPLGR